MNWFEKNPRTKLLGGIEILRLLFKNVDLFTIPLVNS